VHNVIESRKRESRLVAIPLAAALSCAIVISRRPDAFTSPQFFAEDGARWFSDAYNLGPWHAIWLSWEGYFQLLSRLAALVEAPFGASNAPLVFNILGLLVQIGPVLYFISGRFQPVVPSVLCRAAISAVYLLMPST